MLECAVGYVVVCVLFWIGLEAIIYHSNTHHEPKKMIPEEVKRNQP